MNSDKGRRPLKVRELKLMLSIAKKLSQMSITPNQISIFSVFCALMVALCLIAISSGAELYLYWLAALFVQCRLLCNLFDGMVAVEGGKSTASGELFNDIPDRIADPLILIFAGYSINHINWAIEFGWLAGLFAVLTAYVRVLASSIGAPVLFTGPMAKQHRMALITFAFLIMPFESYLKIEQGYVLFLALLVIALGSLITAMRRSHNAYVYLESRQEP